MALSGSMQLLTTKTQVHIQIYLQWFTFTTEGDERVNEINKTALLLYMASRNVLGYAQVYECTHNRDEQKHAQSQAKARASLAMIPQYHEPLAGACLLGGLYQPQRSSETQMCKL